MIAVKKDIQTLMDYVYEACGSTGQISAGIRDYWHEMLTQKELSRHTDGQNYGMSHLIDSLRVWVVTMFCLFIFMVCFVSMISFVSLVFGHGFYTRCCGVLEVFR
jgi:hypothetical protein